MSQSFAIELTEKEVQWLKMVYGLKTDANLRQWLQARVNKDLALLALHCPGRKYIEGNPSEKKQRSQ